MCRWMISLLVVLSTATTAHAQNRGPVIWTISGGAAGFGVGLWAGLSAFDDAVNSDRKVWTAAIVGGGVGAVLGHIIGRTRRDHKHPSTRPDVRQKPRSVMNLSWGLPDLHTVQPLGTIGGRVMGWPSRPNPSGGMAVGW